MQSGKSEIVFLIFAGPNLVLLWFMEVVCFLLLWADNWWQLLQTGQVASPRGKGSNGKFSVLGESLTEQCFMEVEGLSLWTSFSVEEAMTGISYESPCHTAHNLIVHYYLHHYIEISCPFRAGPLIHWLPIFHHPWHLGSTNMFLALALELALALGCWRGTPIGHLE